MLRRRAPLLLSSLALVFAVAALRAADAPPPETATRDLVVVPVAMPQVSPAEASAQIDWTDGILRVTGRGRPWPQANTPARRRFTARDAATLSALRNLGFAIAGAPVTSDDTLAEYVKRLGGKVSFEFQSLRHDRALDPKYSEDDSAEVTLELRLRGKRPLADVLYASRKEEDPKPVLRPEGAAAIEGLTPADARGPFTGLIVVADGLGARPILRPQFYDARGKRVYGPGLASIEAATERGLAAYSRSLVSARKHANAGENPLVVRGAGINERNAGEIFLSKGDADRVRAAEKENGILKNAAVVVVVP